MKPALDAVDNVVMATDFSPKLLREARTLAGLTGAALAARADLHPVTIRNYERGMFCPPDTWRRIEQTLRQALARRVRETQKMRRRFAGRGRLVRHHARHQGDAS